MVLGRQSLGHSGFENRRQDASEVDDVVLQLHNLVALAAALIVEASIGFFGLG